MKRRFHDRILLALFCGGVAVSGICFFLLKFQFDNKYASRPQARQGVLTLEATAPELLFLWDEWAFYAGVLLPPSELDAHVPDYLYLGASGGFGRGKRFGASGGRGTYRLLIEAPSGAQEFALEVPYIFGSYRIWINGVPRRSGTGGGAAPYLTVEPSDGRIEIVVEVESYGQLYDGMVYPPAFGTPAAVWALVLLRGLLAAVLCGCALFLGLLYLIVGLRSGRQRLAFYFALLCLCYAASILRVPLLTLGFSGNTALVLCRICYYGIFMSLLSISAEMLQINVWLRRAAAAAEGLMCLWVLGFQLFGLNGRAAPLRFFGATVAWYKYAAALFLIAAPACSALRKRPHALPLLAGGLFFGAALVADRLYPGYEPALVQWPAETAAMVQIGVIAWTLISDAARVYADNLILLTQKQAAQALMEAQAAQYTALARHFDAFSQLRHDIRSLLIAVERRCAQGEHGKAMELIRQSLGVTEHHALTENNLINAILTVLLKEAETAGVAVRTKFGALPPALNMEDTDLCILLSNLIRNAIEGAAQTPCGRVPIELCLRYADQTLFFSCINVCAGRVRLYNGKPVSQKAAAGHGLGLKTAEQIVLKYGGLLSFFPQEGFFQVLFSIPC